MLSRWFSSSRVMVRWLAKTSCARFMCACARGYCKGSRCVCVWVFRRLAKTAGKDVMGRWLAKRSCALHVRVRSTAEAYRSARHCDCALQRFGSWCERQMRVRILQGMVVVVVVALFWRRKHGVGSTAACVQADGGRSAGCVCVCPRIRVFWVCACSWGPAHAPQ